MERQPAVYVLGGGIGAGKSTVIGAFAAAGFVVVDADEYGHRMLASTMPSGRRVIARWPESVVDGEVSRPRLAEIVFHDPDALAELEAITHPEITAMIEETVEQVIADGVAPGIVIEVPLLRLLSDTPWRRIAVVAPRDIRIERATERGADPDDVRARMEHQEPDEAWAEWADVIIDNGGSLDATLAAVEELITAGDAG